MLITRNIFISVKTLLIEKFFIIFSIEIEFLDSEEILNKKVIAVTNNEINIIGSELLIEDYFNRKNHLLKDFNFDLEKVIEANLAFKTLYDYIYKSNKENELKIHYWGKGDLFDNEFFQRNLYAIGYHQQNYSLKEPSLEFIK